ncbi:uncharacterized protein LOC119575972 [Penaeus monodon]|uniref:uncharacterized protein LOC119575972 n=1 Tax=Penaeus monodon TaxID=6687 RepID=UPI0018A7A5DC|nr:uncharacterized protein LOC119575972 [Penaeus monodon]
MKPIDIHRKQDLLGRWQVQASPAKKEMIWETCGEAAGNEQEHKTKENEAAHLQKENGDLKETIRTKEETIKSLQEMNRNYKTKENEAAHLQKENGDLKETIRTKEETIKSLQEDLEAKTQEMKNKCNMKDAKIDGLQKENLNLKDDILEKKGETSYIRSSVPFHRGTD